jgi:hypothetical protein
MASYTFTYLNIIDMAILMLLFHIFLQTRVLIDDLREVTQGGKSKFGTDSKTLLRVLCHRNDSEASHYVKKQFKIPSSAQSN